jgi:hypothetical protein
MSSLKRTKTTTPEGQGESYVEEVSGAEEQHVAQHPMLLALETHYATVATKEDHLERYTEVNPFE